MHHILAHTDNVSQMHRNQIFTEIKKTCIYVLRHQIKRNPLLSSLLQPSSASTSMSTTAATSHLGGANGLD